MSSVDESKESTTDDEMKSEKPESEDDDTEMKDGDQQKADDDDAQQEENKDIISEDNNGLPEELVRMFRAQKCLLCGATLISPEIAKMHYDSAKHQRKVENYLKNGTAGGPPAKKMRVDDEAKVQLYCTVCCLPLTSQIHADSHYSGKKHKKLAAISHEGMPAKVIGPDSFGQAFRVQQFLEVATKKTRCDVCDLSMTSDVDLRLHMSGKKHMKKVQDLEAAKNQPTNGSAGDISNTLAASRTPSGSFYCDCCNISLNSQRQFSEHLNSKKHVKKKTLKG